MNKLFSIPLLIMGVSMILLGARWMIVDEPWMLDKIANEERLEMTFDKLFEGDINKTLPGYLKQIYRFFGLWVIVIGLFIIGFSRPIIIDNGKIREVILFCTGIMSYSALLLAYKLIPSSPFIYLGWAMIALHFISIYANKYLKR
tara:strand:- start:630 stop:1064 length:435 start_codon:yes stop_codon:yes gene_type:complete